MSFFFFNVEAEFLNLKAGQWHVLSINCFSLGLKLIMVIAVVHFSDFLHPKAHYCDPLYVSKYLFCLKEPASECVFKVSLPANSAAS